MELLIWMESTGFGTWVRESPSIFAYPFVLTLHSIGLAFLVGINIVIDLRILGFARDLPVAPMERLLPVVWIAFWINAASGVALLFGGATTLGRNPLFYLKILAVVLAMATMRLIKRTWLHSVSASPLRFPISVKALAAASLLFWAAAITAGRLTAYLGVPINPLLG